MMDTSVWFVVFGVFLVVAGMTHQVTGLGYGDEDSDTAVDSDENMTETLVSWKTSTL